MTDPKILAQEALALAEAEKHFHYIPRPGEPEGLAIGYAFAEHAKNHYAEICTALLDALKRVERLELDARGTDVHWHGDHWCNCTENLQFNKDPDHESR